MDHRFVQHYALLGLTPDADWRALKAAYRSQIKKWHPDRFLSDVTTRQCAEERTKAINLAYAELSDFHRRYARLPLSVSSAESIHPNSFEPAYSASADYPSSEPPTRNADMFTAPAVRWGTATVAIIVVAWFLIGLINEAPTPSTDVDPHRIETDRPPASVDRNPSSFTYGSSMGDVYTAQGVPSHTDPDVWHYGASKIYFRDGAVVRWEESPERPLKVRIADDTSSSPSLFFSKGSTKAEVRRIQGEPLSENDKVWDYGVSRIYFENDRVVGWYESPLSRLKVRP